MSQCNNIVELPNEILLKEVEKLISEGHDVTLRVRGVSMRPFLEDRRDKIVLTKVQTPQIGDAVLAEIFPGKYVFHRIEPVEVNIEKDSVDLEIRISEGQQATFNHIRISGNDRVYEDVIRRELHTKPGDLFSMESIERTVMTLSNMNQFDPEALSEGSPGRPTRRRPNSPASQPVRRQQTKCW